MLTPSLFVTSGCQPLESGQFLFLYLLSDLLSVPLRDLARVLVQLRLVLELRNAGFLGFLELEELAYVLKAVQVEQVVVLLDLRHVFWPEAELPLLVVVPKHAWLLRALLRCGAFMALAHA